MNGETVAALSGKMRRMMAVLAFGLLVSICLATTTPAQVPSAGGSILVFPDVTIDESTETILQISNLGGAMVHAQCWYVRGEAGGEAEDFDLWLTAHQPTQWVASQGRPVDLADNCTAEHRGDGECAGAGFDPGKIPAVELPFVGELFCVEVDAAGWPVSGNHLFGQATRIDLEGGDVSKYTAHRLRSFDGQNGDWVLCLGGPERLSCPLGGEFEACPETWILSHQADQDGDIDAAVTNRLVVATCSLDLAAGNDEPVSIQFMIINEFEQTFSASTTVRRWAALSSVDVGHIFELAAVGSGALQTRVRVSSGAPSAGILLLAETMGAVTMGGPRGSAALLPHREGERQSGDIVILPEVRR